jgi:hypothetical protein
MKLALTKFIFGDISFTEFYGHKNKNVETTDKILFILSSAFNCTGTHETRIPSTHIVHITVNRISLIRV